MKGINNIEYQHPFNQKAIPVSISYSFSIVKENTSGSYDVLSELRDNLIRWRTSMIHDKNKQFHLAISHFQEIVNKINEGGYDQSILTTNDTLPIFHEVDEIVTICREKLNQKIKEISLMNDVCLLLSLLFQLIQTKDYYPL